MKRFAKNLLFVPCLVILSSAVSANPYADSYGASFTNILKSRNVDKAQNYLDLVKLTDLNEHPDFTAIMQELLNLVAQIERKVSKSTGAKTLSAEEKKLVNAFLSNHDELLENSPTFNKAIIELFVDNYAFTELMRISKSK